MTRSSPQPPPGAATLMLPTVKLAYSNADDAHARGALAGFFGDAGTGKTFAVESWIERRRHPHGWVTASPTPGPKEIFEEIIHAVTGIVPTGTKVQMRRECQELLCDEGPVVVVDEAQNLSYLWLRQLRDLHDRGQGRFAMFLVGGQGCATRIQSDPMLWSRVAYRTWFDRLDGPLLATALSQYHELLANTDERILAAIDRRAEFRGNLRLWTNFLLVAVSLATEDKATRLTEKLVRATFAKMGIDA